MENWINYQLKEKIEKKKKTQATVHNSHEQAVQNNGCMAWSFVLKPSMP